MEKDKKRKKVKKSRCEMKRDVIERSRMSEGDQPGFPKHKLFFFTGESKAAVETSQPDFIKK